MKSFPKRKSQLAFNRLDDQMIIIDFSAHKQFHQASEVGAFIFELCDGSHSVEDIEQAVLSEYETTIEVIKIDVNQFLSELKDNGLIDY